MTYANLGISSAKRENMGVWGRSPQRGAGAEPLLIGVGDGRVVCVVCCGVVLCGVRLCADDILRYVCAIRLCAGRTAPDESATVSRLPSGKL